MYRNNCRYGSAGETEYVAAGNISQFQNITGSDEKKKIYNHYYRGVALCGRQSLYVGTRASHRTCT